MTSDIVERLRNACEDGCDPDLIYEAADTIQALREIADAARAVLAFRVNEPCRGDLRDTDKSRDALSVLDYAVAAYDAAMSTATPSPHTIGAEAGPTGA
jgi:hypothetical protein